MKIAYLTDTGTGRHPDYFKEKGIFCIPLQIALDTLSYQDMEEMSMAQCIQIMKDKKVMSTSLPSLGRLLELFTMFKNEGYERIVAVPICSGLSGTIDAMRQAAAEVNLPITIFDTHVAVIVQEYLIEYIQESMEKGIDEAVLQSQVEQVIASCNTLLVPYDLQHLKRGGRLTPVAAALAGLLKIKPILNINQTTQGRIDVIEKVRTFNRALERVFEILAENKPNKNTFITFAHVDDEETALALKEKATLLFPESQIQVIPLANVVSIHTGLQCQAIQVFDKVAD